MDPRVRIGHTHLRTADIDRVRSFYVDILGFDVIAEARDVPPIRQTADHGTHEAIYVTDPDGNDVELMWDRPVEQWPRDEQGHLAGEFGSELDLDELLTELDRSAHSAPPTWLS